MSLDFQDNPFFRIQEEIDQLHNQYSKLEYITKGAYKLLGNNRPADLCKELEKAIQQKDVVTLEVNNVKLKGLVADLKGQIAEKDKEIKRLNT